MWSETTPPATTGVAVKAPDSGTARADEGFWVAVLPFKYSGNNADLTVLAEGLTEEIVTGLSRFSYLRVIARSSTSRYANTASAIIPLNAVDYCLAALRRKGAKSSLRPTRSQMRARKKRSETGF